MHASCSVHGSAKFQPLAHLYRQKTTDEQRAMFLKSLARVGDILDAFHFHEGDASDDELVATLAKPKDMRDRLMAIRKLLPTPDTRVFRGYRLLKVRF